MISNQPVSIVNLFDGLKLFRNDANSGLALPSSGENRNSILEYSRHCIALPSSGGNCNSILDYSHYRTRFMHRDSLDSMGCFE